MLKVVMSFVDSSGNQLCLLEEKETEFSYLVNLSKMDVSYFGITDSLYDLVERIDVEEPIYADDPLALANWLIENQDDLDCDIYAIINHLEKLKKKEEV